MSLRTALLLILLVTVGFGFFAWQNPGEVVIKLFTLGVYKVPLALLVIFSMLGGAVVAFFLVTVKDLRRSLEQYRANHLARKQELVQNHYTEGMANYLAQRLSSAKSFFHKALSKDPQHIKSLLRLGEIARQEGNLQEAIRLHERAKEAAPQDLEVLMNLEIDYEKMGKKEEALEVLKQVAEGHEEAVAAYIRMRDLYVSLERWEDAYKMQRSIIKIKDAPLNKDQEVKTLMGLRYQVGVAKMKMGEYTEAAKAFRAVINVDKDFIPAYIKAADNFEARGEEGKALQILERGFSQTASSAVLRRLEEFYLDRERPYEIIAFYRGALAQRPDDLFLRYHLGTLYFRLEMVDEAMAQFSLVAQEASAFAMPHYYMAQIHERRTRLREAVREYGTAYELWQYPPALNRCQQCEYVAGEWLDRCPRCGSWNSFEDGLKKEIKPQVPYPLPTSFML